MAAWIKGLFAGIFLAFVAMATTAVIIITLGLFDVSALTPGPKWFDAILSKAMSESVHRRSKKSTPIKVQSDRAVQQRGYLHYKEDCLLCHGAPGAAPKELIRGMNPTPPPLHHVTHPITPEEIHWIIKNGIKMTGMPGWKLIESETDLEAITSFVVALPGLSPEQLKALSGGR